MRLILLFLIFLFISCKREIKQNDIQTKKKDILERIDNFDINYIDPKTTESYETKIYANDTVFFENDFNGANMHFYKKGKKYDANYSENVTDSLIKVYNLKKIEFDTKSNYQEHFEYEDCILKRKVKMDSGAVHTLQDKNGITYQIIDIKHKPIGLQVCYKGKTYKERIQSGINNIYGKLLGNGRSNVVLYDINKDGKDELLIIIDDGGKMTLYTDIYKINLPK